MQVPPVGGNPPIPANSGNNNAYIKQLLQELYTEWKGGYINGNIVNALEQALGESSLPADLKSEITQFIQTLTDPNNAYDKISNNMKIKLDATLSYLLAHIPK